jgi:hypothetical protein
MSAPEFIEAQSELHPHSRGSFVDHLAEDVLPAILKKPLPSK